MVDTPLLLVALGWYKGHTITRLARGYRQDRDVACVAVKRLVDRLNDIFVMAHGGQSYKTKLGLDK